MSNRKNKRTSPACPVCTKHSWKTLTKKKIDKNGLFIVGAKPVYQCRSCGYPANPKKKTVNKLKEFINGKTKSRILQR